MKASSPNNAHGLNSGGWEMEVDHHWWLGAGSPR